MEDVKSLVEALKREVELLRELVKAKDDLIQQLKFAPAPIIIRESHQPVMVPFIQPVITPVAPWQPPYIVTSETIGTPGQESGQIGTFLSLVKAK